MKHWGTNSNSVLKGQEKLAGGETTGYESVTGQRPSGARETSALNTHLSRPFRADDEHRHHSGGYASLHHRLISFVPSGR